jgi:hypothetical protein
MRRCACHARCAFHAELLEAVSAEERTMIPTCLVLLGFGELSFSRTVTAGRPIVRRDTTAAAS